MSYTNGHLSASQREILRLQQTIAHLELAQQEYSMLLNYLITEGNGRFEVSRAKALTLLPLRGVRSEVTATGDMIFTFVEQAPPPPALIIVP